MMRAIPPLIATACRNTPPAKVLLTESNAIDVYEKVLKDVIIYHYAEDYCRVSVNSDTCITSCMSVP